MFQPVHLLAALVAELLMKADLRRLQPVLPPVAPVAVLSVKADLKRVQPALPLLTTVVVLSIKVDPKQSKAVLLAPLIPLPTLWNERSLNLDRAKRRPNPILEPHS